MLPADLAICILILPWCGCRITVMSNVCCPFLIDRLLIYQIAILLSMGGQKQLGKMFGFDCRRFLFYLTPIPFSLTPSHCPPFFLLTSGAPSRVGSLSQEKERKRLLRRLLFSAHLLSEHKRRKTNRRVFVGYWMLRMQKITDIYTTKLPAMSLIVDLS